MTKEEFYKNNQDRIENDFEEHLAYMNDSSEHIRMLRDSESYFWDFVQDMMEEEMKEEYEEKKV